MAVLELAQSVSRTLPSEGGRVRAEEEALGQRYAMRARRRASLARRLFICIVVAPTILSAFYYAFVATPRYVSETQFMVRGLHTSGLLEGLQGLLATFGFARSTDDANAVIAYLSSRDAVAALEKALPLRQLYSPPGVDVLSRFPRPFFGHTSEALLKYYWQRVDIVADSDTGIITLRAAAFRPDDAQAIARQLVKQAEALVNSMNTRMENDTVHSSEVAVADARTLILSTQEALSKFRNNEVVVDPNQNAMAQLATITTLSTQVEQVLAQIGQTGKTSPTNPTLASLQANADALANQIASEQKALAGSRHAIADKVSAYEHLTLLRSLAEFEPDRRDHRL